MTPQSGAPKLPSRVRLVEVGPRDGLQNQGAQIDISLKAEWIRRLASAGLREIEVTSFVHPKWVPQLADAAELTQDLAGLEVELPSALVPNRRGLDRALENGLRRIALFTAASETFSEKNTNCSIAESIERFRQVFDALPTDGDPYFVRGYVSTCFGCPYEGEVDPAQVADVCRQLYEMGAQEIAVSDTIGIATPPQVETVLAAVCQHVPLEAIALHFHDTRGMALVNVLTGLRLGVEVFDASSGGLGGCPYAPGAAGNVATEDVVYLLQSMGVDTGVNLDKLAAASLWFEKETGVTMPGRVLAAYRGTCEL